MNQLFLIKRKKSPCRALWDEGGSMDTVVCKQYPRCQSHTRGGRERFHSLFWGSLSRLPVGGGIWVGPQLSQGNEKESVSGAGLVFCDRIVEKKVGQIGKQLAESRGWSSDQTAGHVGKLTKEGSVSCARLEQEGPFTQMLHYRSREARLRLGEAICSTGNQPLNE